MKSVIIIAIAVVLIVGVSVTSISAQSQYDIPSWVKEIAGFWAEDKITDSEFGEGLSFLIDSNIIKVPLIQELQNENSQLKAEISKLRDQLNLPPSVPPPSSTGGTQQESISVSGIKLWVHTTNVNGLAWGAAGIRNTGDKVLSVDTIQIRGVNIPFAQWYPDVDVTASLFSQALKHTAWDGGGLVKTGTCPGSPRIDINNGQGNICGPQASGPVSLKPGQSAIIYFQLIDGTLTPLDTGVITSVSIFAGRAGAGGGVTVVGVAP